ncbi:rhombotarget lipoprotein [Tolumonas lignilytica]|uniref:rhombotarget lipoprotein n=1 Tax=Tolumonas lignilytica TaxID=1283284 RepID=UPI0004BC6ECF|nr:rhombotarget lipoprotein [Tolumonas lignilytica]
MRRIVLFLVSVCLVGIFSGCASMDQSTKQRQVSSVLAYLYPDSDNLPVKSNSIAVLKVPFRVGIAFVPDNTNAEFRLSESDRQKLATKVRNSFINYPFVSDLVTVPSVYLKSGGGFNNLDQVASMLRLDVIALISFDQIQNSGATKQSLLYWTGVGAYLIQGDQYNILTAVETSVFDIKSRQLLLRAGGISNVDGSASMISFPKQAREARVRGFDQAIDDMINKLHTEVDSFRLHAPADPNIKLILPPGYNANEVHK